MPIKRLLVCRLQWDQKCIATDKIPVQAAKSGLQFKDREGSPEGKTAVKYLKASWIFKTEFKHFKGFLNHDMNAEWKKN